MLLKDFLNLFKSNYFKVYLVIEDMYMRGYYSKDYLITSKYSTYKVRSIVSFWENSTLKEKFIEIIIEK